MVASVCVIKLMLY